MERKDRMNGDGREKQSSVNQESKHINRRGNAEEKERQGEGMERERRWSEEGNQWEGI